MRQCISIFIGLFLISYSAPAQFKGGPGKGNTVAAGSGINLGRNIFIGGVDDGFEVSAATNQPLGRNIFSGGADDGTAVSSATNRPLGRNIFMGGTDDGFEVSAVPNQTLGRNIYKGGADDGFEVSAATNQPLGRNIFSGGANDGWAMAFAPHLPLPITLTSFAGEWQQINALLNWQTASESNSSHFELERSFNGSTFTPIARIAAAGQSSERRSYQYTDAGIKAALPAGVSRVFYRLRSVDLDGKASYSGVVLLQAAGNSSIQYALYPNPAKEVVTISTTEVQPANGTTILVADASGRLLLQQPMANRQQQINISALPDGTYFLQVVTAGKMVYTQKLIIHK